MVPTGEISNRCYDYLSERGEDLFVKEVRVGLSYLGVKLEGNRMGLAAVLRHELTPGCSVLDEAGRLVGAKASDLLRRLVDGRNPLEKSLGLATANAIIHPEPTEEDRNTLELINLGSEDRVAMVGLFRPLVQRIKQTGASLSIIERNPARMEVLDKKEREKILRECTVAIITATTLLNDTMEEILNSLGSPRHVAVLGPSTPMSGEIFEGTQVSHLGGSALLNTKKIMQIISEGGGTAVLRPYLRFVNILLDKD
jgi:uncharacterized protein (DUF4213/DUF364 family)